MGKTEINIGIFLMIVSVLYYALTYQFPEQTLAFSPKIFPRFVAICLFIFSAILTIQGAAAVRRRSGEKQAAPIGVAALDKVFLMRLLVAVLIGFAYTQLLPLTGYVVATPPFIAGIMLVFNEKRWLHIAAVSIITSGLLYVLFRMIFKVPLPRFGLF